jgi:hypothetical protein
VRVDNGPELTAEAFVEWCTAQRIAIGYIQPGKPDQNAFIERFNRTYREEVLDAYLFDSLDQVQAITDAGSSLTSRTRRAPGQLRLGSSWSRSYGPVPARQTVGHRAGIPPFSE